MPAVVALDGKMISCVLFLRKEGVCLIDMFVPDALTWQSGGLCLLDPMSPLR